MRISDWSSDVCSSDLGLSARAYQTFDHPAGARNTLPALPEVETLIDATQDPRCLDFARHERNHGADLSHNTLGGREPILLPIRLRINLDPACRIRSEEHTSELQSLMRISYDVFCLKNKNNMTH